MANALDIGDVAVITATCKIEDGTLTTPSTATFEITANGTKTSYTLASPQVSVPSVGVLKCRHPITVSATHSVRVIATGAVAVVEQTSFSVRPSNQ